MADLNSAKAAKTAMLDFLERFDEHFIDDFSQIIADYRCAFVDLMYEQNSLLPDAESVKLQEETPAIVLSYQLYGSTDYRDDIKDRNGLKNPLFVPASDEVEVLKIDDSSN